MARPPESGNRHWHDRGCRPHDPQLHRLCPGDLRGLPRRLERDTGAAHAPDERDQRHQLGRDRGRHHSRRIQYRRVCSTGWRDCGGTRRRQHLRRVHGDAADALHVQKEGPETGTESGVISPNIVAILYLAASVLFILSLRGLSHPLSARRGNIFGMVGMTIAVLTTFAITRRLEIVLAMLAVGGVTGVVIARRVQMTQMPELVAAMHSLVGLAAVLIAVAVLSDPFAFGVDDPIPMGNRIELFIGTFIGALTFSGSIVAFGKLAGLGKYGRIFSSAPVTFHGQHWVNLALAIAMIVYGVKFVNAIPVDAWDPFLKMAGIAFLLGVLIIIP